MWILGYFVISCTAKTFFKLLFHSFQKLKMFYLFHGIKFSWCYLVSCSCYLSFPIFLYSFKIYRVSSSHPHVFSKNDVLRNFGKFTGKHLCQSLFFFLICRPQPDNFVKKETLALVFCCEFFEISKNTCFHRTPIVAAFLGCD